MSYVALAPVVEFNVPAAAVSYAAPAPGGVDIAASYAAPALVVEFFVPAPTVSCVAHAPVVESSTPAPVVDLNAPAPAVWAALVSKIPLATVRGVNAQVQFVKRFSLASVV